jgi:hypothetical protein
VERLANYPYLLYIFPPRAPQPVIRKDWLEKLGGKRRDGRRLYTACSRPSTMPISTATVRRQHARPHGL